MTRGISHVHRSSVASILAATFLILGAAPVPAQTARSYHRYPSLHGETVVFTSEGDLWRVASS